MGVRFVITVQSLWLLHLLKKAQGDEDSTVVIHVSSMKAGVVRNKGQEKEPPIVDISKYKRCLDSCLSYLGEQGYIESLDFGDGRSIQVKVKHEGWHIGQTVLWKICIFLFRSIAVPIAVAFLTSLITITAIKIL